MRYNIHPRPPHRNLAASKRSIVLACASIAMVLGTTSVGSSLFVDEGQTQALLPTSSLPSAAEQALAPTLPLTTTTQPLGKQHPLVIDPAKSKPAGLMLESVPAAAAAVLTQLSKNYSLPSPSKKASPATTPVPANPPASTTPSTPEPTTSSPPPATPDTPPASPEEPTEEPPTSGTEEPPAQTLMSPSPSSRSSESSSEAEESSL